MKLSNIQIKLPVYFNIIILEKNYSKNLYIILYNDNLYFKIFFKIIKSIKKLIKIDKSSNIIELINKDLINNKNNNNLNLFFKGLNYYYFSKIKFKGKGYKMRFYEDGKFINFHFGTSHKTIVQYKNTKLNILGKYKFILLNSNYHSLQNVIKKTLYIKYINIYTLRGLRLSKQIILKRTGKKGSYV
jgi:ribosomal protein L6P/L9E